jgi:hypothetical protein
MGICPVRTDSIVRSLSQPIGKRRAVQTRSQPADLAIGAGQAQQPPPQHPPPDAAPPAGAPEGLARPPTAIMENSLTVSGWPSGQSIGAEASLIGRVFSKVAPHARHRYS